MVIIPRTSSTAVRREEEREGVAEGITRYTIF